MDDLLGEEAKAFGSLKYTRACCRLLREWYMACTVSLESVERKWMLHSSSTGVQSSSLRGRQHVRDERLLPTTLRAALMCASKACRGSQRERMERDEGDADMADVVAASV
eukprot:2941257-Pleurochrysis_carterae.AAC.3